MRTAVIEFASLARDQRLGLKEKSMNQKPNKEADPDMLEEYDFSNVVRGKYADRFAKGANVVVLDADVAEVFATSESVNEALRAMGVIIRKRVVEIGD